MPFASFKNIQKRNARLHKERSQVLCVILIYLNFSQLLVPGLVHFLKGKISFYVLVIANLNEIRL